MAALTLPRPVALIGQLRIGMRLLAMVVLLLVCVLLFYAAIFACVFLNKHLCPEAESLV